MTRPHTSEDLLCITHISFHYVTVINGADSIFLLEESPPHRLTSSTSDKGVSLLVKKQSLNTRKKMEQAKLFSVVLLGWEVIEVLQQ